MPRETDWETGMERSGLFDDPESPVAMAARRALPYGLKEIPDIKHEDLLLLRTETAIRIYTALVIAGGGAKTEHIDQAVDLTDKLLSVLNRR